MILKSREIRKLIEAIYSKVTKRDQFALLVIVLEIYIDEIVLFSVELTLLTIKRIKKLQGIITSGSIR